jgi:hypothetical protein
VYLHIGLVSQGAEKQTEFTPSQPPQASLASEQTDPREDGDRLLWPQLPQEFKPSNLLSNTISSKYFWVEICF